MRRVVKAVITVDVMASSRPSTLEIIAVMVLIVVSTMVMSMHCGTVVISVETWISPEAIAVLSSTR